MTHEGTQELVLLARVRGQMDTGEAQALRVAAGVSRREAAAAAKVPESTLRHWEKGQRRPRGAAAVRYCSVLDALRAVCHAG